MKLSVLWWLVPCLGLIVIGISIVKILGFIIETGEAGRYGISPPNLILPAIFYLVIGVLSGLISHWVVEHKLNV